MVFHTEQLIKQLQSCLADLCSRDNEEKWQNKSNLKKNDHLKSCRQSHFRTQDGLNGIRGNRRVDILERDQSGTKYTQSIHR